MPMTKSEVNIRDSLLSTLSFLASEQEQLEFASNTYYKDFVGEFACWWFDTFYPEEQSAGAMFSLNQINLLRHFSDVFKRGVDAIDSDGLSMMQLQNEVEWQAVMSAARDTISALKIN